MVLIKTNQIIQRNPKTNKKQYVSEDGTIKNMPTLPKGWQTVKKSNASLDDDSYVIRPDNDLIVIDCDSPEATELLNNLTHSHTITDPENNQLVTTLPYIVEADTKNRHFYFKPTDYYKQSPLATGSRKAINDNKIKIDILQGISLVFTPCPTNHTKHVVQGHLDNLTSISDDLVDKLISLTITDITQQKGDYEPQHSYKAPLVNQALAMFARTNDYMKSLYSLMQIITPSKFRSLLAPTYHPNGVPDGRGIEYLQALSARISGDESIDEKLHKELLTTIATKLWDSPLDKQRLNALFSNLTTQTYAHNGKRLWAYNPDYNSQPLVSVNKAAYMPLFRDIEDKYIVILADGTPQIINGISKLESALASKNYSLMMNGSELQNTPSRKLLVNTMSTVDITYDRRLPPHISRPDNSSMLVFNTFRPNRFLGIIRGEEDVDTPSQGSKEFPTIRFIQDNLVRDHAEPDKAILLLDKFLSRKYKTFEYSPLVFQLLGNRGTGKDTFIDYVLGSIDTVVESNFNASNSQFNADFQRASFIKHAEEAIHSSTMKTIKKISGSQSMRVEGKAKDATTTYNSVTLIITSNDAITIKEELNDRRVVMFSSFQADRLNIPQIKLRILNELPAYCRHLRDIVISDDKFYTDATEWRDLTTDVYMEEKDDSSFIPALTQQLLGRVQSLDYKTLITEIKKIYGQAVFFRLVRDTIRIPLVGLKTTTILATKQPILTPMSVKEARHSALGKYLIRDTTSKNYDRSTYELTIYLTTAQQIDADAHREYMEASINSIDGFDASLDKSII